MILRLRSLGLLFLSGAFLAAVLGGGACIKEGTAHADCQQTSDKDCRPEVRGALLDGTPFQNDSLKGKVVLVNFWATWCAPCERELPALENVFAQHQKDGFVIVGMLSGDRAADGVVRTFLADHDVTYPILRATPDSERAFGASGLLPTSYLYDRAGKLRGRWTGGIEQAALEQQVQALLRE